MLRDYSYSGESEKKYFKKKMADPGYHVHLFCIPAGGYECGYANSSPGTNEENLVYYFMDYTLIFQMFALKMKKALLA